MQVNLKLVTTELVQDLGQELTVEDANAKANATHVQELEVQGSRKGTEEIQFLRQKELTSDNEAPNVKNRCYEYLNLAKGHAVTKDGRLNPSKRDHKHRYKDQKLKPIDDMA